MNVVGHYLLFMPLVALLAWIPLVGYFISHVAILAAVVIGFVWGTCLHLLILAAAWLVYRPLYAILLFLLIGTGIGLLFCGSAITDKDQLTELMNGGVQAAKNTGTLLVNGAA